MDSITQSNIMKLQASGLCKYLPVEIAGQLILGLVDSGNIFYNVISEKLAENLKLNKLSPYNGPPVGTAKAGERLKISGVAKKVKLILFDDNNHKHVIKSDLVVIPQLACGLNISLPFLVKNRLNQMHSENTLFLE